MTLRNWLWNYLLRHFYGAGPCWEGEITPEIEKWAEEVFEKDSVDAREEMKR